MLGTGKTWPSQALGFKTENVFEGLPFAKAVSLEYSTQRECHWEVFHESSHSGTQRSLQPWLRIVVTDWSRYFSFFFRYKKTQDSVVPEACTKIPMKRNLFRTGNM